MEKILIVSNYYPPEKGAAANRIEQLALKLRDNGYAVTVVCPLANYPEGKLFEGYSGKFFKSENLNGIAVKRLWIVPSNSKNAFKRILSVLSFSICLLFFLLFRRIPKKTIVQSPPLLLSFISVFALNLRNRKIILNVSDLWPLAAIELKALKPDSAPHKISLFLERFIYKKSTLILGQSDEILSHVKTIVPNKPCYLYRNLPEHQAQPEIIHGNKRPIRIFYAGLLGVAQGVYTACKKIKLHLPIEIHIFGDGAEKSQIQYMVDNTDGIFHFHGMMPRKELLAKLSDFDIAFVPLKNRIYGSVPSKIFEYSALGFPILYFGGGEGEDIVRDNYLGWVVPVGNYEKLNKTLEKISRLSAGEIYQMKKDVLENASKNFNLDAQMSELISKGVF